MKVLVACEMSGVVRDAFAAKGHDATSCDMQLCDKPGKHYWGDVMDILYEPWDLIVAHPPCTYLSNAGNGHLHRAGRMDKMRNAADFFKIFLNHPCKKICIENPTMTSKAREMVGCGPDQYVHPFMFGHLVMKRTGLWLKGLPNLKREDDREREVLEMRGRDRNWMEMHRNPVHRSFTFTGIAQAMANQWG